jgi:arylsulfatase
MYFDTDDEEMVQVRGMFPIFGEPDTPLYHQRWPTTLPASFFDDLADQPQAIRSYKDFNDKAYGRIPMARREMWHNHVNYNVNCHIDVNQHIGSLLDVLEESGQDANTGIIFTSDHGEMGGAHHLRQKGSVAFKETVNVPLTIVDPRQPGRGRTEAVGSHLDLVPTILAYAGLSEQECRRRYPFLNGRDLSGVVADPASDGPWGSSQNPGAGALLTYDMIYAIDVQWLMSNAPRLMDVAAAKAGLEFKRGREAFQPVLEEIGAPDSRKRELFRGIFDGRYKLVRHFGLGGYNLPQSVDDLLANNDVALYDLRLDPEEMNNLANHDNPDFDEEILATMNSKLNDLITAEIGDDQFLFDVAKLEELQREN